MNKPRSAPSEGSATSGPQQPTHCEEHEYPKRVIDEYTWFPEVRRRGYDCEQVEAGPADKLNLPERQRW